MKSFRNWADEKNYGVTHLGLHFELVDLQQIVFDILHLKLSMTRKIITFICFILETYNYELQQEFVAILRKCWTSFYVDCYESNKSMNMIYREYIN